MKQQLRIALIIAFIAFSVRSEANETVPEIIGKIPVGKLAFVSSESFGSSGTINIVGNQTEKFEGGSPEFFASGTKLIYDNHQGSESRLFIRDLSKNTSLSIDNKAQNSDSPSLSPDGKKLLFVVWPFDRKTSHIYVSNIDGSNWIPLTTGEYYDWSPRWSPDGRKILFESTRDGQRQIYVMDVDGKNQKNLTHDKELGSSPSWSPDGSHIAYMSQGIIVMKSDGTEKKNVSLGKTRDSEPVWSPDGKWIAFTRTSSNAPLPWSMDMWIMKSDGSDQQQITRNKVGISSYDPAWSQ